MASHMFVTRRFPFPRQVSDWVFEGITAKRARAVARNIRVSPAVNVHVGTLGRPGRSGDRRMIVTLDHEDNGQFGYETARLFWTWVPVEVDPRLWRFCSVKTFYHRERAPVVSGQSATSATDQ